MEDLAFTTLRGEFVTWTMIISMAVSIALSAAATGLQMILSPKPKPTRTPTLGDRGQTVTQRQPIGFWRFIYGRTRVGLHPVYMTATDGNDKFHIVGVVACHEIDGFGTIYVKDRPVYAADLDADGLPTKGAFINSGHNTTYLRVKTKLGTASQTAFSDLVSESGGEWTENHRCRGHALLYTRHKFGAEIYASGLPNVSAVVRGKKVYDTRDATTKWTPNLALCIRDYLLTPVDEGGFGAIEDEFTDSDWSAAANICDEIVASPTTGDAAVTHGIHAVSASGDYIDLDGDRLKVQTGDQVALDRSGSITRYVIEVQEQYDDGDQSQDIRYPRIQLATSLANAYAGTAEDLDGTETGPIVKTGEPRFTLNGTFTTDQAPRKILEEMLASSGGRLVYAGGKFRLAGLAWVAPDLALDEDDCRGPFKVQTKRSRRDRFNAIKGTYLSPLNAWQPSDWPAITVPSYEAEDGDVRIFNEFDQPYTSRPGQAQRVAKLMLARNRFERILRLPAKLTAYDCRPGDIITVSNSRWGWDDKPFEVLNRKPVIVDDEGGPYLGLDLTLNEASEDAYDWASTDEQTAPPSIAPTLPLWWLAPTPTGLYIRTATVETEADDIVYTAYLSWSITAEAMVDTAGRFEIQKRRSSGGCLVFDGTDDYVAFATTFSLVNATGFTVEVWAKRDNTAGDRGIFTNGQLSIYKRAADAKIVANVILAAGTVSVVSSSALAADTWTHIAVTYDNDTLTLYIDGVADGTGLEPPSDAPLLTEAGDYLVTEAGDRITTETVDTTIASAMAAQFGRGVDTTAATAYWDGSLDELRIWRGVVKTAAEILAGMEDALTGREDFLLHYWPADVPTSTLVDATPNGNTGTITGATYGLGALASQWEPSWFVDGALRVVELPPLKAAQSYDIRIRSVTSAGIPSAWAMLENFVVGSSGGATETEDWGSIATGGPSTADWGAITDSASSEDDWGALV